MAEREYILFCDESVAEGTYFSNFYGGLLIAASQYRAVSDRLDARKVEQNLLGEIKWQKVTANYLKKYEAMINAIFDEIEAGSLKIRIMFRQNAQQAIGLTDEQRALSYWLLYYQFVKHAFGFDAMPDIGAHLRIFFDRFPDTGEQVAKFKGFIEALAKSPGFRKAGLKIRPQDITEVNSHDHVLLQCLDIVLGAMSFRLNDRHLDKPAGSRFRGSRTIAKETLYKLIHKRLCILKPHFNIGITTGSGAGSRWDLRYAHWKFTPREHEYDGGKTKRGRNKKPT